MNNIHAVGMNSKDELILYLQKLSKNDIESYDFTHKIIELINGCGKSIHGWLAEILIESNLLDTDDIEQKNYVFAVYYALTYYFKRYDKADKLKKALDEYYDIFEYAILREEIASWYYRKIGDLKKAYIYDKNLILKLDIHTNAVPFISYASTISKMLEDEINKTLFKEPLSNWNNINEMTSEWELAIKYMRTAIEQYYVIRNGRNYGKHSFLYGKLVAFNPNIVKQSISELNKTYDEALVYFNKAIEYENENEEDYYKRCDEYRQYQNKCLILKIQLIMTINDFKVSEQLSNLDKLESQIKSCQKNILH